MFVVGALSTVGTRDAVERLCNVIGFFSSTCSTRKMILSEDDGSVDSEEKVLLDIKTYDPEVTELRGRGGNRYPKYERRELGGAKS